MTYTVNSKPGLQKLMSIKCSACNKGNLEKDDLYPDIFKVCTANSDINALYDLTGCLFRRCSACKNLSIICKLCAYGFVKKQSKVPSYEYGECSNCKGCYMLSEDILWKK